MNLALPRRSRRLSRSALLVLALLLAVLLGLTSAPGTASAATKAPAGLKASKLSPTSMTVSWSAVSKAPKYRVKYSTSSKFTSPKYKELTGRTTTLSGLKPATRYYVKVRVIKSNGDGLSGYSAAIKVDTAKAASAASPLRVASYNVRCYNCFDGAANEGTWAQRRGAIVASIRDQDLDVLGVQEASQGRIYDAETGDQNLSQFEDLVNRLGGGWRVTNTNRYNCVNAKSPNNCTYADQGASKGTRIFYDSNRVDLLDQGQALLPKPNADDVRSVAWAKFRQRSTGRAFMFSDLHTTSEDKYHEIKRQQAQVAVDTIKRENTDKLPVIAVGDWNSSRFEKPDNAPYDVFVKAGFVDPLGGKYKTTKTAPGATVEKRIQTWVSSSNHYERQAPAHKDWINGSYIDYLMTTPMRVSEWETVANLDKNGKFIGTIPSDHNMIRATVWLPV